MSVEDGVFPETYRERGLQYASWTDLSAPVPTAKEARALGLLAYPSSTLHTKWDRAVRKEVVKCAKPGYTTSFLLRPNESRDMLGRAFLELAPGNAKIGIQMVTW